MYMHNIYVGAYIIMFIIDHLSAPCSYAVVIVTIIYTGKDL